MKRTLLIAALVVLIQPVIPAQQGAVATAPAPAAAVDEIFSKWTSSTPGCAVGVAVGGKPVLLKAYGMADLEHDVRNTPDTIFEAGSVSKQFTADGRRSCWRSDGKLSLDDPVRKYIPELPDYGKPLTIRHMLDRTPADCATGAASQAIAGWPRTTREYTHAHVLDIVSRQKSLNFDPGTNWSYSNTGFNLAAIIVSRVSGMSFAEFSKQRIFDPLGMTHTSWRDDHTRIVKGRAIAYRWTNGEYQHRDAVRERARQRRPADHGRRSADLERELRQPEGRQREADRRDDDRRPVQRRQAARAYGLGLFVEEYRGVHNVYHSGSTAGYRAHLNRFPDSRTSVAVLCNGSNGDASRSANRVSDVFLGDRLKPAPPAPPAAAPPAALESAALARLS